MEYLISASQSTQALAEVPLFQEDGGFAAGHAEGAGSCSWQTVFQGKAELIGRKASGGNFSGIAIHTWRTTGGLSDWEVFFF